MSESIRVLDRSVQDKINDCLENLREMQEIERQLQQSCGIGPHITALCSSDIDWWLQCWKITRDRNPESYTCLLRAWGHKLRHMKVTLRILAEEAVQVMLKKKWFHKPSVVVDANPSQLQALHEEHLQFELDKLEELACKIRKKHRYLANQVR